MELGLKTEKVSFLKAVFDTNLAQEETVETIVPDTQPDILRLIETSAHVLIKSKEAESGRVTVKGVICATVLYTSGGGDFHKLESELPFTMAAADQDISSACRVIAAIKVMSTDSVVANPRKLVIKAGIAAAIKCFEENETDMCTGIDDACVHQRTKTDKVTVLTEVTEKTFVITDELMIPDTMPPAGELLCAQAAITSCDYTFSGSKLIVRGVVETDVCYIPENGDRARKRKFTSDFSQMVEVETAYDAISADVSVMMTSCYVDFNSYSQAQDGRSIVLEVHAVAQCMISTERDITLTEDAYSNTGALTMTREVVPVASEICSDKHICRVKDTIACPTPATELFNITTQAGEPVHVNGVLKASVYVQASVFGDDGEVYTVRGALAAEIEIEATIESAARIEAAAENVTTSLSADGVSVGADVVFTIFTKQCNIVENIVSADLEPAADEETCPSLIIYRVREGDCMWDIGKRFRSCCSAISKTNKLENELLPEVGGVILIPRA